MKDKKLDDLKKKLDKGTAESKEEAFVKILKEYGDQPEILELVTNKLIKLRSYNAFFEIMKTSEVDLLDEKHIYLERLKSNDHRIRKNLLNQYFVDSFEDEDEVISILNRLITKDPHFHVREQAYTMLVMSIVNDDFDSKWIDHCIDLAFENLSDDGQDSDFGLSHWHVFGRLQYFPFHKRILELMERELTAGYLMKYGSDVLRPAREHPEDYKEIKTVFINLTEQYLDRGNTTFLGKIFNPPSENTKIKSLSEDDLYYLNHLCVEMLNIYPHDADLVNCLYDLTVKFNNWETRLTKRMIKGFLVNIEFSEKLIERYIKNQKIDLLIRYYAIEDLREFYKKPETPEEPADLLNRILKMVSDAPQNFKRDVTNDLFG